MAFIIGISGVDGSGKTTISQLIVQQFKQRGIPVYYRHELEFSAVKFLIRIAGLLMGKGRAESLKQQVLSGKENSRFLVTSFYHVLVWIDSIGTFVTLKLRRGAVIHDRWPFDFLLQFKIRQYNNRIVWFLFQHFPRPNALILLRVSPETAYQRKLTDPGHTDTKLAFYEAQNKYMNEIEEIYSYDQVISTEQLTAEEATIEILNFVVDRFPKNIKW